MNYFDKIVTQPFAYVLLGILQIVGSYGLALIIFTLFTKLVLLPLNIKSKKGMMDQQRIAPKMKELEKKYKGDKQKYQEELQKLYSQEKVNPLSGCLPTLIIIPIMFGLYGAINRPLTFLMGQSADNIKKIAADIGKMISENTLNGLSSITAEKATLFKAFYENFSKVTDGNVSGLALGKLTEIDIAQALNGNLVGNPLFEGFKGLLEINFNFLGFNLAHTPSYSTITLLTLIPIISGLTAFLTSWLSQRLNPTVSTGDKNMAQTSKMMLYLMPLMSVWIGFSIPAGLSLYWISNNLLTALQEYLLTAYFKGKRAREAEAIEASSNKQLQKKKEE